MSPRTTRCPPLVTDHLLLIRRRRRRRRRRRPPLQEAGHMGVSYAVIRLA